MLIIIRGPLGVGKSTVAKLLASKLNAKLFHIDLLLEDLKLDFAPPSHDCIPADHFLKAQDSILSEIEESIANNVLVIIDGNFYHQEQLDQLQSFNPKIFTLQASLETCIRRDAQRTPPHGEAAAKAVYALVNRVSAGTAIQNDSSAQEAVASILAAL